MNAEAPARWDPCEDYALDLMELGDGTLPPERARTVRQHVDGCTRCRHWMAEMTAVGSALAAAMPRPELSPDFDARLRGRIGELSSHTRAERSDLRAAIEHEHERMVDALRRGLRLRTALNAAATASVAGGLLAAAHSIGPDLAHTLGFADSTLFGLSTTAALIVAASIAAAASARRWLGSPSPSVLFG
jgi:anti-sigma factor RsiW